MKEVHAKDGDGNVWSIGNLQTGEWLAGQATGLEKAAGWLKRKATLLFERGKYDEAKAMRELAEKMVKDLEPEMERAVEVHKRSFPSIIEGPGAEEADEGDDSA